MFIKEESQRVTLEILQNMGVITNCEVCGSSYIDMQDLENVYYYFDGNTYELKRIIKNAIYNYVESHQNRWAINGKTIENVLYRRKMCWNCFFKKLWQTEDIAKKARKGKWYKKVFDQKNGPVPYHNTSSATYFSWLFNMPEDVVKRQSLKYATATKEHYTQKYGEELGGIKYKEYCDRQAYTASTEYFINERGMTEEEAKEFHANRACTKKNFIKRYGEKEGISKWNEYCDREAYAGNVLDYYIEKYGKKDGTQKYLEVCVKKATTKDNFVAKYGKEEGLRRYSELEKKRMTGTSVISQKMFKEIDTKLGNYATDSKYESKNFEEMVFITESKYTKPRVYRLDYCLGNKVIEFNGDYWHANPKIYAPDDVVDGTLASDIWNYDNTRLASLTEYGYDVFIVWERDYKKNPSLIIQQCVDFLKS